MVNNELKKQIDLASSDVYGRKAELNTEIHHYEMISKLNIDDILSDIKSSGK